MPPNLASPQLAEYVGRLMKNSRVKDNGQAALVRCFQACSTSWPLRGALLIDERSRGSRTLGKLIRPASPIFA